MWNEHTKTTYSITERNFFVKSHSTGWQTLYLNHLEASFPRPKGAGIHVVLGKDSWHLSTLLTSTNIPLHNPSQTAD